MILRVGIEGARRGTGGVFGGEEMGEEGEEGMGEGEEEGMGEGLGEEGMGEQGGE